MRPKTASKAKEKPRGEVICKAKFFRDKSNIKIFQVRAKRNLKIRENMKMKGLVIRYFMGGYYLCDGKPPKGCENDGELYIGNAVKWFETLEEASAMRGLIDTAYGHTDEEAKTV